MGMKAGNTADEWPVTTFDSWQDRSRTSRGSQEVYEMEQEHILQFFEYGHLPPHLATISKPFCDLAHAIVHGDNHEKSGTVTSGPPVPRNPERSVALRKLLEAKDAAVRAVLAK